MGALSCKFCEFHYHESKNEANIDNLNASQTNINERVKEIKSQYSSQISIDETKLKQMKNNFQKKLPEIGLKISENEFKNIIKEDINNYMERNKINIPKSFPQNNSLFQSEPIKFKNNNIYYGKWNKNNQMEGYGKYYIDDRKIIIEGIWENGSSVYGRIFFENGDIYEGYINNSLPDGKGKIKYSNKDSYEGDFKNGELTGVGKYIFSDKTEYNGNIQNGIFSGKGKMTWINGTEYNGNFSESYLNGEGTIKNNMNDKYHGMFEKNEFNGKGAYYYNNGDIYEGNFEYGIKKGKGKYIRRKDNVIFEGNWNDDLPNGTGIITYNDKKLKCFYRNGVFIGNSDNENNNTFNNIDKNIKPEKFSILPSSLPHLSNADISMNNTSQYAPDFY